MKYSSKFINILSLANLIETLGANSNYDGALILTAFGMIIGKIHLPKELSDKPFVADIVAHSKTVFKSNTEKETNEPLELIGDGSMLIVSDATVLYSNGPTIKTNEITLHCDQVIGFSPVNIENFLAQYNPVR